MHSLWLKLYQKYAIHEANVWCVITCCAEREVGDSSCGLSSKQDRSERWRAAQDMGYFLKQKILFQIVCVCVHVFVTCTGSPILQLLTQREDFPQQHAIGPHVALTAVDVLEQALWRHPPHRQEALVI